MSLAVKAHADVVLYANDTQGPTVYRIGERRHYALRDAPGARTNPPGRSHSIRPGSFLSFQIWGSTNTPRAASTWESSLTGVGSVTRLPLDFRPLGEPL